MILLLDLGNSALKWLLSHDHEFSQPGHVYHHDLHVSALEAIWCKLPRPDSIVVASVAGSSTYTLVESLADKLWGTELWRVQTEAECCGVRNAYAVTKNLGVDRWAAMIAARNRLSGVCCVVDCGTALTIDLVAADGQHQGGVILPGLGMMQESLLRNTHLPVDSVDNKGLLAMANNTRDAVTNGALYACVAAIDRVTHEAAQKTGKQPSCVITGGDSERLLPLLQQPCLHEPDLVLKGIDLIYRQHGQRS